MSAEVAAMTGTGIVALAAGFVLVRPRFMAASGAGRVVVLGPIFYAAALAVFAAEHYTDAHDLMNAVPKWLPDHLFWTYFVGTAWLAAAISFIIWRSVRWSALLTAVLMLTIVVTIDLPNLPKNAHVRFFWILFVREMSFGSGALVLAGSMWRRGSGAGAFFMRVGRVIVALVSIFYAVEHFLHPRFVPGVPLEKPMPAWVPAPVVFSYIVGIILLAGGIGLLIRSTVRIAAATSGTMLLVVTAFLYVPILAMEYHSALAVEGLNYVYDTMLFAGTVLLAGFGPDLGLRDRLADRQSDPAKVVSFQ